MAAPRNSTVDQSSVCCRESVVLTFQRGRCCIGVPEMEEVENVALRQMAWRGPAPSGPAFMLGSTERSTRWHNEALSQTSPLAFP
jgi:hypothetical protein